MATDAPLATFRVLIPIYWHFNTLDVHAPCEVLGNASFAFTPSKMSPFAIQIAAEDISTPTPAYEQISTQPDISFADALEAVNADQVDVMVVPGAGPGAMDPAKNNAGLLALIKSFVDNPSQRQRTLISICTGAELCGLAGAFTGKTATTHWAALGSLQTICGSSTEVIRKRWVDGGTDSKTGLSVISSGGISCGIDACLYFVGQKLGTQTAIDVAQMMDYDWRGPHDGLQPSPSLMSIGLTPTDWTTNQW